MKCTNGVGLGYTTDDDGVHVRCLWVNGGYCDFDVNLGFDAPPEDAMRAQQEHDEREISHG